jgi:hypothetical protein
MSFEHGVMRTCDVPYKYSTVVREPSGILAWVMRVPDTQPVQKFRHPLVVDPRQELPSWNSKIVRMLMLTVNI